MSIKSYWRVYQDYVRSETREEALGILERLRGSQEHLSRLSVHFGRDYGRLPDEFHNMVLLTGGKAAQEYLSNLSGRAEGSGV